MGASIFLSYRRDDSAGTCGRIYDRLVSRFGRDNVFKDVDSIPAGVDYRAHIHAILDQCALQLVVIGQRWLDATDATGRRRLDQPNDLVRLEIEEALQRDLPVIPLLVDDAAMPVEGRLPPSLHALAYRNGLPVRYDPDFEQDMARVVSAIKRLTPGAAVLPSQPQPPHQAPMTQQESVPLAWDATDDERYRNTRPDFNTRWPQFIKTIAVGEHRIDALCSTPITLRQVVFYDGMQVANGRTGWKNWTTYVFTVNEQGHAAHYEVDVGVGAKSAPFMRVRRDGITIFGA